MKPLAGGAIEDGTLALRYVCSNPDVTITIPGMAEIRELEENQKACENQEPLTKEEKEKIQQSVTSWERIFVVVVITVHLAA